MTTERHPLGEPLPYAHYDRRGYKTVSIEEGYGLWSLKYGEFYDRFDIDVFVRSPLVIERTRNARVVDLACGNGRIGKWLRNASAASVVGVDRTPAMLAAAALRGVFESTRLADITATGLPDAAFDGAITSMALCHVPDLHAFFREAARIVKPGGWLATLDFHPFFLFLGIPTHFDPVDGSEPLAIENYIHPLSRFFHAARDTGFVVREMEERFVDAAWVAAMPTYERYLGWPITHFWAFERG
jgi:ubiquinone/menaquinone biosynthesis C-methylase UbiE